MRMTGCATALRRRFAILSGDQRGISLASMALMLPVLIGFVGLAVDVGLWQVNKRAIQGAADRAAYAAAIAACEQTAPVGACARRLGAMPGRATAARPRSGQNRWVYISCTLVCLWVTTTPMPLVTLAEGAMVTEPLNSPAAEIL